MTIKEVKGKLYDAISQDNMDDAIGLLLDAVDARSSKFAQLEGIRKEYNFLKTKILQRSVKTEDAIIKSNALAGQVLDFFHDLDKKDLLTDGAYSDKLIMNPILFITHSTDDNEDLEVFSKMLKLGNVQVRNLMSYVPEDGVYDLVVFDNMDLVQVDNKRLLDRGEVERPQRVLDRIEMMTHILEKTHYYVIHYGPYLYWVEEHEDRFRFADTRFELFKTIHDMLFFINSYRV